MSTRRFLISMLNCVVLVDGAIGCRVMRVRQVGPRIEPVFFHIKPSHKRPGVTKPYFCLDWGIACKKSNYGNPCY